MKNYNFATAPYRHVLMSGLSIDLLGQLSLFFPSDYFSKTRSSKLTIPVMLLIVLIPYSKRVFDKFGIKLSLKRKTNSLLWSI